MDARTDHSNVEVSANLHQSVICKKSITSHVTFRSISTRESSSVPKRGVKTVLQKCCSTITYILCSLLELQAISTRLILENISTHSDLISAEIPVFAKRGFLGFPQPLQENPVFHILYNSLFTDNPPFEGI